MCSLLLFVLLLSVQTLIPCSHAIIINEPVGIAGYYDTLKATFSAPAPQFLNAQLVYAVPASGCSVPTNNVTGKIVLFDAGLCLQLTIAQNIKAAGGAAALSNFNSPSLINVMSSSTFESAGIPTYYISSTAVAILKPFLANGTYINATLGYQPSPQAHTNALLDFFGATGGATSWRFGKAGQYNSWNTANGHPCQVWYGVLCHDLTGNVHGVVLTSNTLSGTIPTSMGNIETLRILQLTSNSVSGTVPESIWGLTTLRQIILTTNLLTGTISPSIGGNTRLNLLALDSNGFSGAIPSEIGSLTRLTSLLLNVNSFSGVVPDFSTLTGLTALNLANNKLSGTVPAGLDGLISLVTLDLSRNGFSGNLPDLSGITTLQTLDISYNFFTGPLPPLLGRLTSLTKLSVTNNTLSGVFPSISNLTKLATLDISRNKFSGNLGGSSVLPTSLTQLTASYNEFISIGSDFSGLKLLTFVDLSNNFLSSILVMQYLPRPAAADLLAGRNGLSTINLSHNLLKNVSLDVEMSITGFPSLTTLDLSYNALAGRLSYPYSPSLNPFLATLDLSNNPMTGTIPNDFGGLPALKSLKVQNTRLHRASSGSLLPTFIVPDYTSTSINTTGNFFCPSLTGHSAGLIVQVDNNYHDYLLCYCNAGFRRDPMSVQLRCIPCPNHFICPGGEFDQEAYYAAKFFPTPNVEAPVMMLTCPNCQNENSQNFSCLPGYTDRLCAKCEPGFYLRSSECYECSTGGGYILFAAVVVVVILAIVFFSLAFTKMGIFTQDTAENELQEIEAKKDLTPIPKYNAREKYCWGLVGKLSLYDSRAIFEIVINYAQTLSILSKYLPLSNSITGIIGALDIANITAGGFGVECIRSEFLETYARFLFSALQPAVIVAGFLFIFYLGSFILKAFKRDTMWWKNVCMRCMLVILDFLFFPIILSCIAIFSCTEDPVTQVSYITNSPYTQCNDIPIGIKVLMLILQLAILFVFAGLLIFFKVSKNKKSKMMILQRFGFFFHDFKSNWFFVGLVIMSRRLIFSLLNGLLAVESINLYFANCFIILMSLMFYYSFQPYKSKIDNYLEILAHVSLLLCYGVVYVSAVLKETTTLAGDFYISWNAVLFFVMLIIVVFSKVPSIADLISFLTCQFAQRKSATKISVWQADA